MNTLQHELAEAATGLEAASNAAMERLGLAPNTFAWFTGEEYYPMKPQKIIPDSNLKHDRYRSSVTFYGGGYVNPRAPGDFVCGHLSADIAEPLTGRSKHQSGRGSLPAPYIPRLLKSKDGVITVDTPSVKRSKNDGPVVVEGMGSNVRYRKTTRFNTQTGSVAIRSGELITFGDGWGRNDDRTVEQDASELPENIVVPRLVTMLRTVQAVSSIFEKIGDTNAQDFAWSVTPHANL